MPLDPATVWLIVVVGVMTFGALWYETHWGGL
jgi:hypothetical protein